MKKVFVFLSIFLLSFSGVLFACNEDKYADLRVVLSSVTNADSGGTLSPNEDGVYEIYYGDTVRINAEVSSSSDVSRVLDFVSHSSDNFPEISSSRTQTSAEFKAEMPSKGEIFRVTVKSRETNRGSLDLRFNVLLPTDEISLSDNLGLVSGIELDLNDNVDFVSDLTSAYEPDEKGVSFAISSYIDENGDDFKVELKENGVYYIAGSSTPSFALNDGIIEIMDNTLDGQVVVEAVSEKYDINLESNLEDMDLTDEEKQALIAENNRLKDLTNIDIVQKITLDDITFSGAQIGFMNYKSSDKQVKLSADLYNNVSSKYVYNGSKYSYQFERVNVLVASQEDFEIVYEIGDMIIGDEIYQSQSGVINVSNVSGTENNKVFEFLSGEAGTAYVDFVIQYNFDNVIEFSFSDLYLEYLNSLESSVYEQLNEYEKYTKLVFNVSRLPESITVTQDDEIVLRDGRYVDKVQTDEIAIFDTYTGTKNQNGSIIKLNLGGTGVLDENKTVRVYIKGQTAEIVVSDYLTIVDSNKTTIPLSNIDIDDVTYYYFDLDVTNEKTSMFYIRAKNVNESNLFSLEFENIIGSKVYNREGEEVTSTLAGNKVGTQVVTSKGIQSLEVKTISGTNEFVNLDLEHIGNNEDYLKQMVLSKDKKTGSLLAYFYDEGADCNVAISGYDKNIIELVKTSEDDSTLEDLFGKAYDDSLLDIGGVLVFRGLKAGSTSITFTAENGYTTSVNVLVVNDVSDINFTIEELTADTVNADLLTNPDNYVSMKYGYSFDIKVNTISATGIIGTSFTSTNSAVASIDARNGRVTANREGTTTITATVSYYTFGTIVGAGDYIVWDKAEKQLKFELEVYIPLEDIRVTQNAILVYDVNSLAYDNTDKARINIGVDIVADDATIKNDPNAVRIEVRGADYLQGVEYDINNNTIIGTNLSAVASLPKTAKSATVKFIIYVNEFGTEITRECSINIVRATQVDSIDVAVSQEDDNVVVDRAQEEYSFRIRSGETVDVRAIVEPDNVLDKRLVARIESEEGDVIDIAGLSFGDSYNVSEIKLNAGETFSLGTKEGSSGTFDLILIASDSCIREDNYTTYRIIHITIEDGVKYAYSISNSQELKDIELAPEKNYMLVSDIILLSQWEPIKNFTGVLNGNNHTITGLQISKLQSNKVGLFEEINNYYSVVNEETGTTALTRYGTVYDLKLVVSSININSENSEQLLVGALAGENKGIIMNVAVEFGDIKVNALGDTNVGGLVGLNSGVVYNFSIDVHRDNEDDETIATKYFGVDPALSLFNRFETGNVPSDVNVDDCIAENYSVGNITVTSSGLAYVGGLVGRNNHRINGYYGVYSQQKQSDGTIIVTSYQSEGIDVRVDINVNGGSLTNENSAIGGISGYNGGIISNVAVEGNIGNYSFVDGVLLGTKDNVGGIIGVNNGGYLLNATTSVKVRGEENVGGAVGLSLGSSSNTGKINNVYVESYRQFNQADNTLIVGQNNVGGIIGNASNTDIEDSYSYGYADKFEDMYVLYGDIYVYGQDAFAGGITGKNSAVSATTVFSTFNIIAGQSSNVRGLFGSGDVYVSNAFYVGVFDVIESLSSINDILGVVQMASDNVPFYYVLKYAQEDTLMQDLTTQSGFDCFVAVKYFDDGVQEDNPNIVFDCFVLGDEDEGYSLVEILKRTELLRDLPVEIDVTGAGANATQEEDEYILEFSTNTNRNVFYNYSYMDLNNNKQNVLIINYSAGLSNFELSELFTVATKPEGIKRVNLLVEKVEQNNNVLTIYRNGTVTINSLGEIDLEFSLRENSSVKSRVHVIVIPNFDKLLLSTSFTYTPSLFDNTQDNPLYVVKDRAVNFNYLLVEGQENSEIGYTNNYTIEYDVLFSDTVNGEYSTSEEIEGYYSLTNGEMVISQVGYYRVAVSLVFSDNSGTKYRIKDSSWVFYLQAGVSAYDISTNADQIVIEGDSSEDILVTLIASEQEEIPNLSMRLKTPTGAEFNLIRTVVDEMTGECLYDDEESPFNISLIPHSQEQGGFHYAVSISLKDEYKDTSVVETYNLMIFDEAGALINDYADLNIVISPASLNSISLAHYTYESQMGSSSDGQNLPTEFYSYSLLQKDSIVPVYGGMLTIDIVPFYANIKSITISSSLGTAGDGVEFVQMVKVKDSLDANKFYYVYGPTTKVNADGSLSLNLVSSISNAEVIVTNGNGVLNVDGEIKYAFDEEANYPNVGRLYVRTIAPSSISELDNFDITVKVEYNWLNEDGVLTTRTETRTKRLDIVSTPGISLTTSNNGNERDIIAYTGTNLENATQADYVDVFANVEKDYEYDVSFTIISNGQDMGESTDYAVLTPQGDKYVLTLGPKAQVGDKIRLSLDVEVNYGNETVVQHYIKEIVVVDAVINSVIIEGMDENADVKMTRASARPLRIEIDGYGTNEALNTIAQNVSRAVVSPQGTPYYWFGEIGNTGNYVNINSADLQSYLPFIVNQLPIDNENIQEYIVNSSMLGFVSGNEQSFTMAYDTIYLDGATSYDSVSLCVSFSYVYNEGRVLLVPNSINTSYKQEMYFTVSIVQGEEEDLTEINDEGDLDLLESDDGTGHYILMNDLTLDVYRPIVANCASFDGNNKVVTINSFWYEAGSPDFASSSNLGLFSTISRDTIIKNLIVALPNNKTTSMGLTNYSTLNFGAIAGQNYGIITNCDVITTSVSTTPNYTLNFDTTGGRNINIGLFVGINNGIITNSRVGRDEVEVLRSESSESVIVRRVLLDDVASRTIVNVTGPANVGGFVAVNSGTISSSYAENLQIEVFDGRNQSSTNIRTAGFAVTNGGYINGSFASGYEEEDYAGTQGLRNANRKLGGGLYSNGPISGFVFNNQNYIQDCYSNINLSGNYETSAKTNGIITRLNGENLESVSASGFVYNMSDNAYVYTSYSLSKIGVNPNTHSAFEGTLDALNVIGETVSQRGTIENCYFLRESNENFTIVEERAMELSDSVVISSTDEDVQSGVNQFTNRDSFNGFAFDYDIDDFSTYTGAGTGGVWAITLGAENSGYPELISANTIALSTRVGKTTENENGGTTTRYYYVADYELGSQNNPYLIASAEQYNNIFRAYNLGTPTGDITAKFTGNVRLINYIDFDGINPLSTSVEYTSKLGERAVFDGNYLAMYNVSLTDSSAGSHSFGLFRDIYEVGVKNITLGVSRINAGNSTSVGALAGVIVNSDISNISLVSSSSNNSGILGNNYVGGLAGIITAGSTGEIYYIANIKSNLTVMGGRDSGSSSTSSIKSSFDVWSKIEPTSASGTGGRDLRLHNLDKNVFYAGGIAGVIDLRQQTSEGGTAILSTENAKNLLVGEFAKGADYIPETNYSVGVGVLSDYVGGLFGFIGEQTYLAKSQYIASNASSISGKQVAGGIAGVNFGFIAKTYVSYNKEIMEEEDKYLVYYALGVDYTRSSEVTDRLFSADEEEYAPKYIGGIAGINAGASTSGSGTIADSYNRVDVKNSGSIGVGGIVGASYIGEIRNVYTTASVIANLDTKNPQDVYIGGIIGKIFDDASEGYFSDSISGEKTLTLSNIVALNAYDEDDFELLFNYNQVKPGRLGGLYGKYENQTEQKMGIVRIEPNSNIYVPTYILKNYNNEYLASISAYDDFVIGPKTNDDGDYVATYVDANADGVADSEEVTYIRLWGSETETEGSIYYDEFLAEYFSGNDNYKIDPQDYRILFGGSNIAIEANLSGDISQDEYNLLRDTYFSSVNWPRTTWQYEDADLLPLLSYGYDSSVVRIYTAEQFIQAVSSKNNAEMTYLVMNDIDFSGIKDLSPITTTFSGRLTGNAVTYTEGGREYSRYPILFNIGINATDVGASSYALFETVSGGSISNLNFVISDYNVQFASEVMSSAVAGILIADAENVTINNVNIYNSLIDNVSKYASNRTYSTSLSDVDFNVTQGLAYNDANIVDSISSVSYLKLAEVVGLTEYSGTTYLFTLNLDGQKNFFAVKSTITNGVETPTTLSYTIEIKQDGKINTNASTFGAIVATTGESTVTIENSGASVDVMFTYSGSVSSVYAGGIVGYGKGYIRNSSSQSKMEIQSSLANKASGERDISSLYLGLVAGYFQGELENIYVSNGAITVGGSPQGQRTEDEIVVNSSSSGISGAYIGGVVGSLGRYQNTNSSTMTGLLESVYVYDLAIETYITGRASIAGVVGKNQAETRDIYVRQSGVTSEITSLVGGRSGGGILVHINNENSNANVAGVFAESTTSILENIYSNISIKVDSTVYNNLYLGGIIGQSTSDLQMLNVVNDAEKLEVVKNPIEREDGTVYYENDVIYVGGLVASGESITLDQAISSADIIINQENTMFVGGTVGFVKTLVVNNVIVLSDITLKRGRGNGDSYFYLNGSDYYVGGLAGQILSTLTVTGRSDEEILVASTIRDYAIAQKLDAHIGSVIGGNINAITYNGDLSKINFNENISLVLNNNNTNVTGSGGNVGISPSSVSNFSAISQLDLGAKFKEIFGLFVETSSGNLVKLETVEYQSGKYSTLYSDYCTSDDELYAGSKLNPIVYTGGSLVNSQYYILTSDLQLASTISANDTKNWVLNAQGYSITTVANGNVLPVLDTITEGSAVIGLMVNISGETSAQNSFAGIAKNNYGFIFACGVSGDINKNTNAQSVVSIVNRNYGVINSVFSLADITSIGAAGLVLYNGYDSEDFIGNIYDSYYTGSITASGGSETSTYSGMAYRSDFGVISNSYTMADIEAPETSYDNTFPVVGIDKKSGAVVKNNLYRTFYDYVAYLGNNEGTNVNSIINAGSNNELFITNLGIYVWTTTFSGDLTLDNPSNPSIGASVTIIDILQNNWIGVSNKFELINNFAVINIKESTEIDTTWFNFGYATKNLQNIFVGEDEVEKTKNYFLMIYTGNGLADISNVRGEGAPNLAEHANGFADMPYSIKHGGLLDMLVVENCRDNTPKFRYYIFTRNINLIKYQNGTYWSENWDKINAIFVGSLDGDGKIVSNMFSTYGLVRAMPSVSGVVETIEVKNVKFNKGNISKTGLVAGYLGGGQIHNITITDEGDQGANYIYNGNLFDVIGKDKMDLYKTETGDIDPKFDILEETITKIDMKTFTGNNDGAITESDYIPATDLYQNEDKKTTFAGGLVGVMTGGLITNITIQKLTVMAYNEISDGDDTKVDLSKTKNEISYTGGIVGIMRGGIITSTVVEGQIEDQTIIGTVDIQGITVASSFKDSQMVQPFSYVGGIAGYMGGASSIIQGIDMKNDLNNANKSVTIATIYTAGGFVGVLDGGTVTNCNYLVYSDFSNSTGLRIGYVNWEEKDGVISATTSDLSQLSLSANIGAIYSTEFALGGIAGLMRSGTIKNSNFGSNDKSAMVNINPNSLGGFYSIHLGGIVGDLNEKQVVANSSTNSAEAIITNCKVVNSVLKMKSAQEGIVGGIAGRMRGGTIRNVSTTGSVTSLTADLTVYLNGNFEGNFDSEAVEMYKQIGDYYADNWIRLGVVSPKFKNYFGYYTENVGLGQGIEHFVDVWGGLQMKTSEGYSVAGGIVGRLIYGKLMGDYGRSEEETEQNPYGRILNNATITSNYSTGGVIGEILNTELTYSDKKSVLVSGVENTGSVQGVGAIMMTGGIGSTLVGEMDLESLKEAMFDLVGSLFSDNDFLVEAAGGLKQANAGGIVGYILSDNLRNPSPFVTIDNCASVHYNTNGIHSSPVVGSALATFSGGIVGLAHGGVSTNIVISNCESNNTLQGYLIRSFAGGIVGFLDGATVVDCTYSASLLSQLSTLLNIGEDTGPSNEEISSGIGDFLKAFSSVLGIPNVAGGIVGYSNSGTVKDCAVSSFNVTDGGIYDKISSFVPGIIMGVRVAGGICGIAAGGEFVSDTIMYNNNMVYALYGIAGGLFGVLAGAEIDSFGGNLSLTSVFDEFLKTFIKEDENNDSGVDISTEDPAGSFERGFNKIFGGSDESGAGIMVNGITGFVFGYISGGIIGYYDSATISLVDRNGNPSGNRSAKDLHGVFNFGRVYSNITLLFTSGSVIKELQELEESIMSANIDGDINDMDFDDLVPSLSEKIEDFGFGFSTGVTVDGQKVPIIEIGSTTNLLLMFDFDVSVDVDIGFDSVSGVEFGDYFTNIVANEYSWNPYWGPNDGGLEVGGLTATSNICNVGDDFFDSTIVDTADTGLLDDNINHTSDSVQAGRGSVGGIIGYKSGKNDLTISLAFNYGITLPDLGGVGSYLSPAIVSSGIAGGIVGFAESGLTVTSSTNFLNVIGRTAGGIIGFADSSSVRVVSANPNVSFAGTNLTDLIKSVLNEETFYSQVQNMGMVNGEIFAGGIYGYARNATINSAQIEYLLMAHDIGYYYDWSFFGSTGGDQYDWFQSLDLSGWGVLQVINSGSVISSKYAGGLIGFMDEGSGAYVARVNPGVGALLGSLDNLIDAITGNLKQNIFGCYSGGIVGYMQGGYISGTCSVGNDGFNVGEVNIAAAKSTLAFGEEKNDLIASEGQSAYKYGGFAGGVAGILRDGKIGGKNSLHPTGKILQTKVSSNVTYGMSKNQDAEYVGGAIGYYDKAQIVTGTGAESSEVAPLDIHVNVTGTVSNGKYVGGYFGRINDGGGISFKIGETTSETDETVKYPVIEILGLFTEMTESSSRQGTLTVKGSEGGYAGGVVGYLKNGKLQNIISSIYVTGDADSTMGGVVGYMNGGTITDVVYAKVVTDVVDPLKNEATIKYGEQLVIIDKKLDFNKVYNGSVGGIVGLADVNENNNESKDNTVYINNAIVLADMSGGWYSGGIVGSLENGIIESSHVIGSVEDARYAGGIAGKIGEKGIINSSDIGQYNDNMNFTQTVDYLSKNYLNGLKIVATDLEVRVNISGSFAAGGVAGLSSGNINYSNINEERVTVTSTDIPEDTEQEEASRDELFLQFPGYVGGIVGQLMGGSIGVSEDQLGDGLKVITGANVSGRTAGGVVGSMFGGEIINAKSRNVEVTDDGFYGGGFVGYMYGGQVTKVTSDENENVTVLANVNGAESDDDMDGIALGGVVGLYRGGQLRSFDAVKVNGGMYGGGIVGELEGDFPSIDGFVPDSIMSEYAGGLIGRYVSGSILGSEIRNQNNVDIYGSKAAGGIVGFAMKDTNSTNNKIEIMVSRISSGSGDQLDISSENYTGGLIGEVRDLEIHVNRAFTVIGNLSGKYIGGIVGHMKGTNAKLGGTDQRSRSSVTFSCKVDVIGNESYFGGVVGHLEEGAVFFIYMREDTCDSLTLGIESNLIVGSVVGMSYGGYIYNCENNFDQFSDVVADQNDVVKITIQGGIVGVASHTYVVDCVNNADIKAISPNVILGGIAGKAVSATIAGATNNGDLILGATPTFVGNGYNSIATKDVGPWAESETKPSGIRGSSANVTSFSQFLSSSNGVVGGIVGVASVERTTEEGQATIEKTIVEGTNKGDVYGYYYYSTRSSNGEEPEYDKLYSYNPEGDDADLAYKVYVSDKRGNIVGVIDSSEELKKHIQVKNSGDTHPTKTKVGEPQEVEITWADRNENIEIGKQISHVIGYKIVFNNHTWLPVEGGGWTENPVVIPNTKYFLMRATTDFDNSLLPKEVTGASQIIVTTQLLGQGFEECDFPIEMLEETEIISEELAHESEDTKLNTTGLQGSPTPGVPYDIIDVYKYTAEIDTTYTFQHYLYEGLQDVGYTTGDDGYVRDAKSRDEYLTHEYQNMQIVLEMYDQCVCEEGILDMPVLPKVEDIGYKTQASGETGGEEGGETGGEETTTSNVISKNLTASAKTGSITGDNITANASLKNTTQTTAGSDSSTNLSGETSGESATIFSTTASGTINLTGDKKRKTDRLFKV